jgi:hypothetical protein
VVQGIAVAAAAVTVGTPAHQAAAAPPAQGGNAACRADGQLIVPVVDAVHTYGWAFVANFDHAPSATTVTTCLVERTWLAGPGTPGPVEFTIGTGECTVMNNVAAPPAQFGNGIAAFDGNAYLSCTLPVPATVPSIFWVRARLIPSAALQTHTLLASTPVTFMAQSASNCTLRLTSAYSLRNPSNAGQYSHDASVACGASTVIGTRLIAAAAHASEGGHRVNAAFFGPVALAGRLELPGDYAFNIGAVGQPYALDWLVIDPTPSRGGA